MVYKYHFEPIPSEWLSDPVLSRTEPLVLQILANRGFKTAAEVSDFLFPDFSAVIKAVGLKDMDKLVERLSRALNGHEKIVVYHDYDVDGICGCTIMVENLRRMGGDVEFYANDRLVDGFGMCPNGVEQIMKRWPETRVILTVDNGIVAFDGVEAANKLGVDVLITDHHEPGAALPSAYAVVDARRKDETYPFRDFCGAGLALKAMSALARRLRRDVSEVCRSADMAALAAVADVVPLHGENRTIVHEGTRVLTNGDRPAIRALNTVKNVARVTAHGTVAFTYAPMINAVSRMGQDTRHVINFLMEPDEGKCRKTALWLDEVNEQRKAETAREEDISQKMLAEENNPDPECIVLYNDSFKEGIVGIVAGRLKNRYNVPVIVFAPREPGLIKASARSVPGLNLIETLMMLPEYTVKCGGHAAAAGLTIQKADFDAFKDAFTKLCHDRNDISKNNVSPPLDAIVDSSELNEEFVRSLSALEPFGEGFPEPLFGLTADIDEVRFMGQGQKHVKYMDTRHNVSIIEWGGGDKARAKAEPPCRFVGHLELNEFNGNVSVQMIVDQRNK